MGPSLPYDIWCLVANFIPKLELSRLYRVNSAFFHMAMNERYCQVMIHDIADENTRRCLMNMSPVVATRVRTLILRPHLFGKFMNTHIVPFAGRLNFVRQAGKHIKSSALLRHLTCMTEVTSLTIGCYPSDDLRMFNSTTLLIAAAWSAHGSRVRSLSLAIPLEAYPKVLTAAPTFKSLEDLNITLRVEHAIPIAIDETIFSLIISFIGLHAQSLHGLSVDIPRAAVNPFRFFHNLGQLPQLKRLSINLPLNRLRPGFLTGIDSFLRKQANTLRDLSILICDLLPNNLSLLLTPDDFFSHPIFQVQIRLTYLELGLLPWTKTGQRSLMTASLTRYLYPMRMTLSRLALRDHTLTFTEVQSVVAVFSTPGSQLQSLEMRIYFLSCNLLDLLSQRLPNLHHLELGFEALTGQDSGAWIETVYWYRFTHSLEASTFFEGMANRTYPDWALRRLTMPTYYCSGKWNETRALLVAALPSVVTFNGLSPDEFVKVPDYTRSY
ncbi:hypothetical protein GALMADRAFT_244391 [Galerina marginata CBS 339.88]|uniref:F-box domain-containing protein n=1 Tax=Galerina marginata (strain CBS 339.88) TaxID=685588 RepID=A0A067TIK8_GALM3|nr:hypothetical protein GALMADRAFT_244391 [Galerina marginata CBS 339.88]